MGLLDYGNFQDGSYINLTKSPAPPKDGVGIVTNMANNINHRVESGKTIEEAVELAKKAFKVGTHIAELSLRQYLMQYCKMGVHEAHFQVYGKVYKSGRRGK
jgi:hypothetical protein